MEGEREMEKNGLRDCMYIFYSRRVWSATGSVFTAALVRVNAVWLDRQVGNDAQENEKTNWHDEPVIRWKSFVTQQTVVEVKQNNRQNWNECRTWLRFAILKGRYPQP